MGHPFSSRKVISSFVFGKRMILHSWGISPRIHTGWDTAVTFSHAQIVFHKGYLPPPPPAPRGTTVKHKPFLFTSPKTTSASRASQSSFQGNFHVYQYFFAGVEFLPSLESSPNTVGTSGITEEKAVLKEEIIFLIILLIVESEG